MYFDSMLAAFKRSLKNNLVISFRIVNEILIISVCEFLLEIYSDFLKKEYIMQRKRCTSIGSFLDTNVCSAEWGSKRLCNLLWVFFFWPSGMGVLPHSVQGCQLNPVM